MRAIRASSPQQWLVPLLIIVLTFGLTALVGWRYGAGVGDSANPLILVGLAILLVYIIFRHPYWGLGLVIALLPITDSLPKLPFVSSLSPVIGAATLAAFLFERRRLGLSFFPKRFHLTYAFALLFVLWILVSNPEAALRSGRGVALLTYFQLLILLWMGGELLVHLPVNRSVMWLYVAACLISAWVAIQNSSLGATFSTEGKSGLGGISSAARQFAAAIVILFFLRSILKRGSQRFLIALTWIAQIVLLEGIALTGSRTGILILAIGFVVILLSPTSKIRPQRVIVPAVIAFTIYVVVPSTYWDSMWNSIFPTLEEGSDTVGIRYELWNTAMRMVEDKPITGVGINQFANNVLKYSDPLSSTVVVVGAHSIYFSVIAETGVIGFIFFMGMLVCAIYYALRAAWQLKNQDEAFLSYTWFAVLVLILIGGITKHDQYDKLLWLTLGACTAMENIRLRETASQIQQQFIPQKHFIARNSRG
ncbi:MAG: O-antigen ligase family protein [Anaerolineae bacterium]|nr:O-antigen ligase family protein [Anaerolineae bacterium]